MFVGSLAVTALLGMMALLMPSVPREEELLATSGLLTGYSLLGLVASLAIAKRRSLVLAWTAVGTLGASLALWLTLIWFATWRWEAGETLVRLGGTLTIVGLLALHSVLLSFPRLDRSAGRATRMGTIAAAVGAGSLAMLLMWDIGIFDEEAVGRLMGALLIPGALGTIAVPVLARIEHLASRDGEEHTLGRSVPVHIRCPRCELAQELAANRKGRCSGCGLEMTVKLAEPRCRCGYLLYGLHEPRCPECGGEVPADLWSRERPVAQLGEASDAGTSS
jgi:hypothetical protein